MSLWWSEDFNVVDDFQVSWDLFSEAIRSDKLLFSPESTSKFYYSFLKILKLLEQNLFFIEWKLTHYIIFAFPIVLAWFHGCKTVFETWCITLCCISLNFFMSLQIFTSDSFERSALFPLQNACILKCLQMDYFSNIIKISNI